MNPFAYVAPQDTAAALNAIQAEPDTDSRMPPRFLAGGTNLVDLMKADVMHPARLVDVNGLPLDRIEETADAGLHLGALARNADTAYHPLVRTRYPLLTAAILRARPRRSAIWPATAAICCNARAAITFTTSACRVINAIRAAAVRPSAALRASTPSSAQRTLYCHPSIRSVRGTGGAGSHGPCAINARHAPDCVCRIPSFARRPAARRHHAGRR